MRSLSVCLGDVHGPPPRQLGTVGREPGAHSYLCSLCSSEAHFLKGGNWHFYISYGIPPPYL